MSSSFCFLANVLFFVVGNIGEFSQHSSACLERITQQLQASNSAQRITCLDAFIAKKDKGKIGGFKSLWGQGGGNWCLWLETNRTWSLLRVCGEETLRHIAWTKVGKDRVTHTDKPPRYRQNTGECKYWCFRCSGFKIGIRSKASFTMDVHRSWSSPDLIWNGGIWVAEHDPNALLRNLWLELTNISSCHQ